RMAYTRRCRCAPRPKAEAGRQEGVGSGRQDGPGGSRSREVAMSERFGRPGALAAVLALGLGLASTAGAQSYLSNPNRDDFINAFGRSADAPPATDEQGVRRKGTTRGLQINVPAATATRPSAEAMPAP